MLLSKLIDRVMLSACVFVTTRRFRADTLNVLIEVNMELVMYKHLIQVSIIILSLSGFTTANAKEGGNTWQSLFPSVPTISQSEIEQHKADLVFVDVRAKFHFDKQHKEGIEHVSFSSRMFMIKMESLIEKNEGKTIVVYCDSNNCIKSYRAVEKCQKAEFKNVVIFDRNEDIAKLKASSVYTQLNLSQF